MIILTVSPFAQHHSFFLLSWLCPGLASLVPLRSNSALLALLSLILPLFIVFFFLSFFFHPKLCPSLPALTLGYNEYPLTWSCNTDIFGLCSYLDSSTQDIAWLFQSHLFQTEYFISIF